MAAAMRYAHPDAIADTQWLADNLRDPLLRAFDCTTYPRYETGTGRPYRVEPGGSAEEQRGLLLPRQTSTAACPLPAG